MAARSSCDINGNVATLSGVLDETVQLPRLLQHQQGGRLVLDLDAVTFINSPGIREWIRMQQAAAAANVRIELRRVAEPIVHQLNIMPAARGVSLVTSFYAPYVCDDCDAENLVLLDVTTHGADLAKQRAPMITCPDCKRRMELAHQPELYFMFLGG
jgi:DNA-directed RNA polymerase subunit RPC12/RpoP